MRYFFLFWLTWVSSTLLPAQGRIFYDYWHLTQSDLELAGRANPDLQRFGGDAAALGDLDGDGLQEIAVGEMGQETGRLWILSLDTAGQIQRVRELKPQGMSLGGQLGRRVQAVGDWDGDGIADVGVGEPRAQDLGLPTGAVWILLLHADATLKEAICLDRSEPTLRSALRQGQLFGHDLAPVGDLDGNGQPDLAVGVPGIESKHTGRVLLLLMEDPRTVRQVLDLGEVAPELGKQLIRGDQFGFAVEALPGDTYAQLAIGAPGDDASGVDQGALYLAQLDSGGMVSAWHKIINDQAGWDVFLEADDRWTSGLAYLPGWSKDSTLALVTGVSQDDDGRKNQGALYVIYLQANGKVSGHHKISLTTGNFEGEFEGMGYYQWGYSVSPAGDLDGDGREDLLVNGDQHFAPIKRGSLWILRPTDWPARLQKKLTWEQGAFSITAADSARIYAGAQTPADSARIDSLYDLSSYAPSHVIFLLDVSASMNDGDKLPLLREAFIGVLPFLRPEDRVSIVTYSGQPATPLAAAPASERDLITQTLVNLESRGQTRPKKALQMAYELAEDHFIPEGNNRIILATDGGFDFSSLDRVLEKNASGAVPLSVFYFGKVAQWQVDAMGEIARQGKGNLSHIVGSSASEALLQEVKVIRKKE